MLLETQDAPILNEVLVGLTVREALDKSLPVHLAKQEGLVVINRGCEIHRDEWDNIRLVESDRLVVCLRPQGGGGGSNRSKGLIQVVVGIILVAASWWAGGSGGWAVFGSMGVSNAAASSMLLAVGSSLIL